MCVERVEHRKGGRGGAKKHTQFSPVQSTVPIVVLLSRCLLFVAVVAVAAVAVATVVINDADVSSCPLSYLVVLGLHTCKEC